MSTLPDCLSRALQLYLLIVVLSGCAAPQSLGPQVDLAITAVVEVHAGSGVPAIGAAVASADEVLAVAVDGVRKLGTNDPVRVLDAFHIGSVTKTMTATLAGQLVESGALSWTTRVAELLPDPISQGRPEYRDITLAQLLSHEAGIRPMTEEEEFVDVPELRGGIIEQRRQFAGWLLQRPPVASVGDEYAYSNGGFVIAAAMMEAATGQSWESMMRERIFEPLGMRTADFGWPGANTQDDGFLWGHEARGDVIIPVDPNGDYQLPRVLAPAGDVHASLGDMARFASAYLRALQGSESIIKGETIRTMYRPRIKSGLGWGVQAAFGFDSVAVYSGSADTFFFVIAVIPEANRTIVAASNAADDEAQQATIELLKLLAAEYTSKNR